MNDFDREQPVAGEKREASFSTTPDEPLAYTTPEQQITILQGMTDGLLAWDRQWRLVYVNAEAEQILQQSARDVLGKNIWELFPDLKETSLYTLCLQAMQEQKRISYDHFSSRLNRWFQIHLYPISDGLSIYLRDITKSKQAEHVLQESEERFRISIENLLDSFGIYTAVRDNRGQIVDFRIEYVNQAACVSNRRTREEQVGRSLFEMIFPLKETNLFEAFCQVVETGKPFSNDLFVYQGEHSGQKVRKAYEIRAAKLNDGLTAAWRDITERKEAEIALQRSQAKTQRLIDANIIGVVSVDDGLITEANDAFLTMVGYTRDDLQQHKLNWRLMTPPEYGELDQKAIEQIVSCGACVPYEKEFYRKDGSRVPILIGVALLPGEPLQSVGFIMDITAQKELENRKDEFISIASHELKTPITSLKGLTQLFKRKIEKHHESDPLEYITRMDAQVSYLTRLINELLDVSKIRFGKLEYHLETFDFDPFLQDIVENFDPMAEFQHTITIKGTTGKRVTGDKDRLKQVIINLLSNAIKYSPQADRVEIGLSSKNDTVTISVRDYGMGIPQEQINHIFTRFYRTDRPEMKRTPGLGMGLYITQEIIAFHHGTIHVESKVRQGSTFSITLPALTEANPNTQNETLHHPHYQESGSG